MNEITKLARDLRKNQTAAEIRIWAEIRSRKLSVKFRRQHPITFIYEGKSCFFISDFACVEKKLIIELDGRIHENLSDRDFARDYIIKYLGFSIIRFTNEMIFNEIEKVKEAINFKIHC